jgi:peptidoglycan/LPS O-acetylase OafA/YrhL
LVTIAVGPLFRLFFGLGTGTAAGIVVTPILPLSCLDTLGVGALLALRKDQIAGQQSDEYPFGDAGLLLGFVALGVFVLLRAMNQAWTIGYATFDLGAALLGGWVVLRASTGFRGPIGKLLELKPLIYLGTISYGIYVYHNFIPYLMYKTLGLRSIANLLGLPYAWPLDSLLEGGITISVAALSWHFFESPINRLKRLFPYRKTSLDSRVGHTLPATGPEQVDIF